MISKSFSNDLVDKDIRRLQAILNSVSSAVLEISAMGDILYANQAAVQMLGYSQAEFKNRCVADLVPERYNRGDQKHLHSFLKVNIAPPSVKGEVLSLLHENGQELLVTIDLKPLVNSLQNSVIATFYESPNLKSAQDQLDNSNERLKVAKEAAQIGVFELNVKTGELFWDEQMFLLYGIDPEKFNGTLSEWSNSLHPQDKQKALETIGITIEEKKKFDTAFRIMTADKQVRYIRAYGRPIIDSSGKVCKIIGVNCALTENFTVEENLKQSLKSNRTLARVAEETFDAVIFTDEKGNITWVNKMFTQISGYSLDEVKGLTPGSVLQGKNTDPQTIKEFSLALKNEKNINVEMLNYHKNGTPYWLRINCQPLHEQNQLIGFMAIQTDITKIKNISILVTNWFKLLWLGKVNTIN